MSGYRGGGGGRGGERGGDRGGRGRGGGRGGGGRDGGRGGGRDGGRGGGRDGGRGYQGGGGRDGGGGRGGRDGGGYQGGRGGGGYQGGRDGGGGGRGGFGRGGGGGRGPDHSGLKQVLTNILPAKLSDTFSFYLYSIDSVDKKGNGIESRGRRMDLFGKGFYDGLLAGMTQVQKNELKKMLIFTGSSFYSARRIEELSRSNLPCTLCDGTSTDGDTMSCVSVKKFTAPVCLRPATPAAVAQGLGEVQFDAMRCHNCTRTFTDEDSLLQHCRDAGHAPIYGSVDADEEQDASPATVEFFSSYVNLMLQRAMGLSWTRWGREFVDRDAPIVAKDRNGNELGVSIFEAISLSFGVMKVGGPQAILALTCDLRAKVIRNGSVYDSIYERRNPRQAVSKNDQTTLKREWIGEVVIYKNDHKCYTVTDLLFDKSAASLPVSDKGISHAEYFAKKGVILNYPDAAPMVAVQGRREQTIYLPPELVAGNTLDPRVREMLPQIASFRPETRNAAIEKVKAFLKPGTQRSSGGSLLPAIGIVLQDERIKTAAKVLPAPTLMAAGVAIPKKNSENWAPLLGSANFNINPKSAVTLNVVVFHHKQLKPGALLVYERIRDFVNNFNSFFRFPAKPHALVEAGDREAHWGEFQKFFPTRACDNIFVLDFVKPRGPMDDAYPVIKQMLGRGGYLSQFVNFKTYSHDQPRDVKRSNIILQGVARQVLQKCGVRLWWTEIPKSLPLPCVLVGVDVFHAPMVYNPMTKKRGRKASVAAIIVQILRAGENSAKRIEIYSKTYRRGGGNEYELGDALEETIAEATRALKVKPMSAVVWRDGIAESAEHHAIEEVNGVRRGLDGVTVGTGTTARTPLSYIVCQKRIATKLLTTDGAYGAPSGTMVTGLQGLKHQTFYINGRAPPYSTPKPVRFICVVRDEKLNGVPMGEMTWNYCHDYPNWTGPVKVPSVCQMAHKLAELAGAFDDGGESIEAGKYKNTVYFL